MIFRPPIFISAVSTEFKESRDLVAKILQRLGYEPVFQDIFGTEHGDLREVLRKKIDDCKAVIQFVGYRYGSEPPMPDKRFGRVSYTQYEACYAKYKGKDVWYFIDISRSPDDKEPIEPDEVRQLQEQYRKSIKAGPEIYYEIDLKNADAIKITVHEIKDELAKLRRAFQRWTISVMVLLLIILSFVVLLWASHESLFTTGFFAPNTKISANSGSWAWDRFISVRVAQAALGTLLSEEPYQLQLEMKNRTTMPLVITRITVFSRNKQAAQLLGMDSPQVHKADIRMTSLLNGHEGVVIDVRLNEILPEEITVQIYHNHSEAISEFRIDLEGRALPMPAPRYLARKMVFVGYDSMLALQQAANEARSWSPDAQIAAIFPGDNKVYIDEESRLKYMKIESWVLNFYSPSKDLNFFAIASIGGIKGTENNKPADPEFKKSVNPSAPKLGYHQALDLANRSSLLSADWNSPRFNVVEVQGESVCAWFLPYRAPSGLPIIIDAMTGDQLVPRTKDELRRVPIQPSALIE